MLMLMMLTHLVGALPLHLRLALLALLVKHRALDLKVVDHPFPDILIIMIILLIIWFSEKSFCKYGALDLKVVDNTFPDSHFDHNGHYQDMIITPIEVKRHHPTQKSSSANLFGEHDLHVTNHQMSGKFHSVKK